MTTLLMPMGGALDERDEAVVLKEFLRRAGGPQARILVFPQASQRKQAGKELTDLFLEWGAAEAIALEFRIRTAADEEDNLRAVRRASGIFFGGGAQLRLSALLGGTRLEAELLAAFRAGAIVGGTSAGASILSKTMIALGKSGPTPRFGLLHMSPGLGFTDRFMFDQHFRQRDRFGRLTYAVCSHPGIIGIGIDENTAALIEDENRLTVYGAGAVTVVDGRQIEACTLPEVESPAPIAVSHLIVHVLTAGCAYERESGQTSIPALRLVDE
ncbi:MAG: cyanophycinase [Anaerolineales bacterium]